MTTRRENYRQTKTLLAQHPDLAGIYNIGGGPRASPARCKEAGASTRSSSSAMA
jgi:ABC-type sugar transport system substrate-binding protein